MTDDGSRQGMAIAHRRHFLRVLVLAGLAASPAMAPNPGIAQPKRIAV